MGQTIILSSDDEGAILNQMKQLPAYPDVAPGLARLRQENSGWPL